MGHAQPPQAQPGIGAAHDHQVGLVRQAVDEVLDLFVACPRLDEVEVVEHEHQVVRHGAEGRDDRQRQGLRTIGGSPGHAGGIDHGQHAARPFERGGHVTPQTHCVVVALVEGHPREGGASLAAQALGDHGGLAVAGRRRHEGDRVAQRAAHRVHQARTIDPARARRRWVELGLRAMVHRGHESRARRRRIRPERAHRPTSPFRPVPECCVDRRTPYGGGRCDFRPGTVPGPPPDRPAETLTAARSRALTARSAAGRQRVPA